MKKTIKLIEAMRSRWLCAIVLVAVIGFSFAACDNGVGGGDEGDPQTVTYTGTSGSTTYTLKITENTARYTAQSGDAYTLTSGTKTSTGIVDTVAGGVLTLKPSNASITFTATVSGNSLTALNGTVTWIDNTTETAPGEFTGVGTDITNVPGAGLAAKLQWLKNNAASDTKYLIEVNADEAIAPHTLSYDGKTGVAVTIKGVGIERTVSLTENGTLFTVNSGVTLTLSDNITLTGGGMNNAALIEVNNDGKLIMKDGAKLTNNQNRGVYLYGKNTSFVMDGGEITDNFCGASYGGGGVIVRWGTFVMNGGLIAHNKYSNTVGGGGGVSVQSGSFTMNGGKISGNTVENNIGTGGGVSNDLGTFTMTGGEISGNKITAWDNPSGDGGGVSSNGTFTMTGGMIKGNSARYGGGVQIHSGVFEVDGGIIYGSDGGENANTATNNETSGSAIYVYSYGGYVHRETTVSANERLYVSHNPQTNEGAWEVY